MEYTISRVAELSGVTQRTLRYYDEIGLLKPRRRNSSSYRIYGKEELNRLQQILFYRELGMDLIMIQEILGNDDYSIEMALMQQKELLLKKRAHLNQLLKTLERTLAEQRGELIMTDAEKFEGFKKEMIEENEQRFGKEIRECYGNETIEKANAKMMGMDIETYKKFTKLGEDLHQTLAKAVETKDCTSPLAQQAAALHKQWLLFTWPQYSSESHANLVEMYVQDDRFNQYYHGYAAFLRDAVHHMLSLEQ
jgi:DNA-binding transcriptional MerR regulator